MPQLKIREMPREERPREKLAAHGASALTDPELIAILLRTGVPGANAIEVARKLLKDYNSLSGLSRCTVDELARDSRYWSRQSRAASRGLWTRAAACAGNIIKAKDRFTRTRERTRRARDAPAAERIAARDSARYALSLDSSRRSLNRKRERKYRASARHISARRHFLGIRCHSRTQSPFRRCVAEPDGPQPDETVGRSRRASAN